MCEPPPRNESIALEKGDHNGYTIVILFCVMGNLVFKECLVGRRGMPNGSAKPEKHLDKIPLEMTIMTVSCSAAKTFSGLIQCIDDNPNCPTVRHRWCRSVTVDGDNCGYKFVGGS